VSTLKGEITTYLNISDSHHTMKGAILGYCLLSIAILLLVAGCTAQLPPKEGELTKDLVHYPHFFFDDNQEFTGVIIVDELAEQGDLDSAALLVEALRKYDPTIDEKVVKGFPTYSDLQAKNAILIGSCSQEPHNRFINIYTDCLSMRPEQSLLRVIDHQGTWLLYVAGSTTETTRNAIEVLINFEDYPLEDNDVEVVRENGELIVRDPQ
jgi:hypothetical protein